MAKKKEKEKAIKMRLEGASYSQIRAAVPVAKSTLSNWLKDMPLSEGRIRELRDNSPIRIEKFRSTMREKREAKRQIEYESAKKDVGKLTKRDLFIAGLFLYWGEGSKTESTLVALSNSDAKAITFFIQWLDMLGVQKSQLRVRLHLYSDMQIQTEQDWWSQQLGISPEQFRKPYIKKSKQSDITWKHPSQHGTCNVLYGNRQLHDYVMMAIEYIKKEVICP